MSFFIIYNIQIQNKIDFIDLIYEAIRFQIKNIYLLIRLRQTALYSWQYIRQIDNRMYQFFVNQS